MTSIARLSRPQHLGKIVLLVFLAAIAGIAAGPVHSFDLFWQLQSGREMWQSGTLIRTDLFTLAAAAPRFEHCWLHDLIVYAAFKAGAYPAISLLKGLLVTATCALTVLAARRRGASWLGIVAIAPLCWLLTGGGWLERPQLWSMLFFVVFLWLLGGDTSRHRWRLWLLLPLTILWSNLHAGAVLAVPLLWAVVAGVWTEQSLRGGKAECDGATARHLLWVALLAAPALLCTPYGGEMLQALWLAPRAGADSGLATQLYNLDWSATSWSREPFYFVLLAVSVVVLAICRRSIALADLLVLGLLALMGYKLGRHTPFFFFGVAVLLPRYLDVVAAGIGLRLTERWSRGLGYVVLALAIGLFVLFYRPSLANSGFFQVGLRDWHYPVKATEFVRAERLPGRLWNTYDWGGYLEWQLYPQYLVFWDGRQSSPEMFAYGMTVMRGDAGWDTVLNRFEINTVVTKTCTVESGQRYPLVDRLAQAQEWALVFAEVPALIFVRRSAVESAWLQTHAVPLERIDDVVLSEARLLVGVEPRRYLGWWEIARILVARRDYDGALPALENYLRYSPTPDPRAENLYRIIAPLRQRQP